MIKFIQNQSSFVKPVKLKTLSVGSVAGFCNSGEALTEEQALQTILHFAKIIVLPTNCEKRGKSEISVLRFSNEGFNDSVCEFNEDVSVIPLNYEMNLSVKMDKKNS